MGLLDRLRWADTEGRLGRSGLVLAGLVVAVGVEDAFLWGWPLSGAVPAPDGGVGLFTLHGGPTVAGGAGVVG